MYTLGGKYLNVGITLVNQWEYYFTTEGQGVRWGLLNGCDAIVIPVGRSLSPHVLPLSVSNNRLSLLKLAFVNAKIRKG